MNSFRKRTALRIAAVSVLLAALASPLAGFIARHNAEQAIISLAWEESGRLLQRYGSFDLDNPKAPESAVHFRNSLRVNLAMTTLLLGRGCFCKLAG